MSSELETRTDAAPMPATLHDKMEYAKALAVADLVPDSFKRKPANILIAQEFAAALNVNPVILMQEMAVIGGKPALSAKFMRSLARRAGHTVRESLSADGVARCTIIRNDDPGYEHTVEWTKAKAEKHGYWGKGHWVKDPGLMLGNRALSGCVRLACPEVLGGISYTDDEIRDMGPIQTGPPVAGGAVTAAEIVGGPTSVAEPETVDAEMVDDPAMFDAEFVDENGVVA